MSYENISQPQIDCLTCSNVSQLPACLYARVVLSPDGRSYLLHCLGPEVPYTAVFSLTSGQLETVVETNQHIRDSLAEKDLPFSQTLEVRPAGAGEETIPVKLLVPPGLREKEGERTGLVIMLGREVSARWTCDLDCLVVGEGYAVALLDITELHRLEEVVGLLTDLKWVDPTRLAVFGTGLGGHTALSVLLANTEALNTIQCGAVQAPLTDWALGTEQYLYVGREMERLPTNDQ